MDVWGRVEFAAFGIASHERACMDGWMNGCGTNEVYEHGRHPSVLDRPGNENASKPIALLLRIVVD